MILRKQEDTGNWERKHWSTRSDSTENSLCKTDCGMNEWMNKWMNEWINDLNLCPSIKLPRKCQVRKWPQFCEYLTVHYDSVALKYDAASLGIYRRFDKRSGLILKVETILEKPTSVTNYPATRHHIPANWYHVKFYYKFWKKWQNRKCRHNWHYYYYLQQLGFHPVAVVLH
jgi:hypothetical protein